ncbi:MAG: hypothetical protein IKI40_10085 [Treponema sp.]|nr:hypothetical protein [Treponema sp.]
MTSDQIYSLITHSGQYSLPYLFRFHHEDFGTLLLCGNNEAITYDGETYLPANIKYTRPKSQNGVLTGGTLTASLIGNTLSEFFAVGDFLMSVEVVGIIAEGGTVEPFRAFRHRYGDMTVSDMDLTISFTADDRMGMTFPPDVFDADNNRGNA